MHTVSILSDYNFQEAKGVLPLQMRTVKSQAIYIRYSGLSLWLKRATHVAVISKVTPEYLDNQN